MKVTTRAVEMLKKDHDKIKELFERFENSIHTEERLEIMAEITKELRIHTTLEEEVFYPEAKKKLHKNELIRHYLEEHHEFDDTLQELEECDPDDERYDELFETLSESVNDHIQDEESRLFPEFEKASNIDFEALSKQLNKRKKELKREYP